MSSRDFFQLSIYLLALIFATPGLGAFLARAFQGKPTLLSPVLGPVERATYRMAGVDETREMGSTEYCLALLAFNAVGLAFLFIVQLIQGWLPLNPARLGNVPGTPRVQYGRQLHDEHELAGVFGRGNDELPHADARTDRAEFRERSDGDCGHARSHTRGRRPLRECTWQFLGRSDAQHTVCAAASLSLVFAVVLVSQGVVQTFSGYAHATTLEGAAQQIPLGPAASQIAIKQLGTNGGSFLGVNSAHPFENPTPLSNFLEVLAILLIPASQGSFERPAAQSSSSRCLCRQEPVWQSAFAQARNASGTQL